jgi:hypothetical protein
VEKLILSSKESLRKEIPLKARDNLNIPEEGSSEESDSEGVGAPESESSETESQDPK